MPVKQTLIQRAFSAGEISPKFYGRADLVQYSTGARRVRNFFIRKEGGLSNRAGFRYRSTTKSGATGLVKIYRWAFTAAENSVLIEAGHLYFRFYSQGAPLTVVIAGLAAWNNATNYVQSDLVQFGGVAYYAIQDNVNQQPDTNPDDWYPLTTVGANAIYEIPTPYTAGSFDSPGPLVFVQSGAIITITHPAYQPRELQNLDVLGGTLRWRLVPVSTAPTVQPPVALLGTPGGVGTRTYRYIVTCATEEDYEESIGSAILTLANVANPTETSPHTISWTDPNATPSAEYYVYCDPYNNNVFGFIGTAVGQLNFRDVGFVPDFALTPPLERILFTTTNNFPWISAYYQQRRLFAYTHNEPAKVWASRSGFRNNFSISSPIGDDDAITFKHESADMNVVRHLISLKRLVMLTETGEWVVRGDESGALRPTAIVLDQEGYSGAHPAFPAVMGSTILYVQARGSIVRDLVFTEDTALVATRDLTIFASHLFSRRTMGRIEIVQDPHPIAYVTRDDGVLLGCTYIGGTDVWGWHRHDTEQNATDGFIEDICMVPEADRDVLYAVIRRTINGATVRYIEELENREIDENNFNVECFFVDAGLSYSGAPTNTVTGLSHLEGQVVAVVGDGTVVYDGNPSGASAASFTVVGGSITLPASYSNIHVGLRIAFPEVETLDPDSPSSALRDRMKKVNAVSVLVDETTQNFAVGPDENNLVAARAEPWEANANARVSKHVSVAITSEWKEGARLFIRQTNPMPITILALLPNDDIGG